MGKSDPDPVAVIAILCCLGGIFGQWQFFTWLKLGLWPHFPLSVATGPPPRVEWIGLQQIINYVDDCPLALILFFVLCGAAAIWAFQVAETQRRRI